MAEKNIDYKCYVDAVKAQREYQDDWLRNGYAPKGFYLKDFCIIRSDDVFHLFHIAGTPGVSCCLPGNELWFGHATTRDFLTWETHEPCFYIDTNSWDNGHVFAPYVIYAKDRYWMYYTGVSIDNTQRISVAVSDDLYEWKRIVDAPVIRPESYAWAFCPTERGSACRDPHVMMHGSEFLMYYTAVTKTGKGCVACASSTDLVNWEDRGPVFVSGESAHCESSNVQELDGSYLLFFGGHYEYWSFVKSEDPLDWKGREVIPLKKQITAMEVIARKGSKWLVAYFKFDAYRLFTGVLDWSADRPGIQQVEQPEMLLAFLDDEDI